MLQSAAGLSLMTVILVILVKWPSLVVLNADVVVVVGEMPGIVVVVVVVVVEVVNEVVEVVVGVEVVVNGPGARNITKASHRTRSLHVYTFLSSDFD